MPSIEAHISPPVMQWARMKAGFDVFTAADKLKRPYEEIEKWESGEKKPTIAQVREAAKLYQRPLAVFFLTEPPTDFDVLRDYRHLPGTEGAKYSTNFLFLQRQIQDKFLWAREYLVSGGAEDLPFVGSATLDDDVAELARRIKNEINIDYSLQIGAKTALNALNYWVFRVEESGINVLSSRDFPCQDARGFVISDGIAPFIYLNSNDTHTGQLFTLAHELSHVWLGNSSITTIEDMANKVNNNIVELFCNRVASHLLVERPLLRSLFNETDSSNPIFNRISYVSKRLNVSNEVVARILLDDNAINAEEYGEIRAITVQFLKQQKQKTGGPHPILLKARKNGKLFCRTVLSAYNNGHVSGRDASSLLDTKINHFSQLRHYSNHYSL